jgi:hypothetical protein
MKNIKFIILMLVFILALAEPGWATTYFVDTASSGGDGTTQATSGPQAAFATVAAAQAAVTGNQSDNSLLFKRGCTWNEQFVVGAYGTVGHPFTIGAYGSGAQPKFSASGVQHAWVPIYVLNKDYITIDGIMIDGITYDAGDYTVVPNRCGIKIYSTSGSHYGFIVQNCTISNVVGPVWDDGTCGFSAIRAVGRTTDAAGSLIGVTFKNNVLDHLDTNNSDGICVWGNVVNWSMIANEAKNGNNIPGCQSFGFDPDLTGETQYQPRKGLISGNYIHDCTSTHGIGVGIYINGGEEIIIEKNIIKNCDGGIGITSENYATPNYFSHDIIVRNNIINSTSLYGISMGWAPYMNYNIHIVNNSLYAAGMSALDYRYVTNSEIKNNIIYPKSGTRVLISIYDSDGQTGNVIDYNCYCNPAKTQTGTVYSYNGVTSSTLAAWKTATKQEAHGFFADPKYVTEGSDFHLQATSPCSNAGTPVTLTAYFADPEAIANATPRPDIGALQHLSASPPLAALMLLLDDNNQ